MTGHSVGVRDIRKASDGIGGHSMGGVSIKFSIIWHCRAEATIRIVPGEVTEDVLPSVELQFVACTHSQQILTSSWQQQKEAFQ